MQKNEVYKTLIEDLTSEGNGVCRIDGMAVFVPHTAIGDRIEVKIVKVLKQYAFGIVNKILEPSPYRIEEDCNLKSCGGCMFRHISYNSELAWKEKLVKDVFQRIGKLSPEILPILRCENRCRYRNKAQYPFSVDKNGIPVIGFYAKRSHCVISVEDCLLQPELFSKIAETVRSYAEKNKISIYNENTCTGILRHLYLRQGYHTGEVMICLIVRKQSERIFKGLISKLTEKFHEIKSIVMNVNPEKTNVILGKKTITLWGKDTITDIMCGNIITISPQSFYQVNTFQAERLYRIAKKFANLTGEELLLDLYCGAGTIGLSMADSVKSLIGVEIIPEAIENAKENAKQSNILNAEFICGDAGEIAKKLVNEGMKPDVIVVDPPRKGCDNVAIQTIVDMQPSRIVMISCNPATAARDCSLFSEMGYSVDKVQPVDLFAGTGHVECVVLMSRSEKDLISRNS